MEEKPRYVKPDPGLGFPPKGPKVAVPYQWQRDMAGVALTRSAGEGQQRLDRVCKAHDLTWGIVQTVYRGEDDNTTGYRPEDRTKIGVLVLIGQVFEGQAEAMPSGADRFHPWDAADECLNQIGEFLESQYGDSNDPSDE